MTGSIAREARIVMPTNPKDPHKSGDIHRSLGRALCEAFGGYTATEGTGGWIDPDTDQMVYDQVVVYDVAMPDEFAYFRQLREIAVRFGRLLDQKAVYVRTPEGRVEIIPLDQRPGANVGTEERQAKPLGAKRLPKPGEVWATRSGGWAAVARPASVLDGGYNCVLVEQGKMAVAPGYAFVVGIDGRHSRGGEEHPLDLVGHPISYR